MKKRIFAITLILSIGMCFISCSKENFKNSINDQKNAVLNDKVNPNVPDCGEGYHWDYGLGECVLNDCQPGFHWDGIQGKCVFTEITVITNSNNPYDSAGSRHNQAINSILGDLSSESTNGDVIQYTLDYLAPLNYDTSELRSEYILSDSLGNFGYSDVDSLAYKMNANSEISNTAENYLLDLSSIINNVIGDYDPTDSIYEVFANDAITYESSITSDNSLSSNEKKMLLSAFSVGRFSAQYWGNYIQNNSEAEEMSASFSNNPESLSFLKKFWKKVLGADVAGAITGAGTAIQSSKSVIRGGIFGAIIGSAAAAVKELISPS